nr:hypothetical protein [Tanacetum cinerariifolium]
MTANSIVLHASPLLGNGDGCCYWAPLEFQYFTWLYATRVLSIKEIKSFLDAVGITAAQVYVNTALMNHKEFDLLKWDLQVEVIENGATLPKTKVVEGVITEKPVTTAEEKAQKRLERFGEHAATKKTKRNLLKQQYENFTAPSSKMLDQTFDWFQKLVRKKLTVNGNETISFDKFNVECYNCHKRGHFAKECRALRNQDNKHKESSRRSVSVETSTFTTLVSCDGLGGYDWSDQAEEGPNYALMAFSSSSFDLEEKYLLESLRKKLKIAQKEKDGIQLNVDKFKHAYKSLNKLIECQILDNYKKGLGYENYNVVLPPYIGNFMPPTLDISFTGLDEFVNKPVVKNCKAKSSKEEPDVVMKNDDALIIDEWVSDNEKEDGNPQMDLQDQGVIDSGCSRHMTGNMSYLTYYEEIDRGYVAFGGNPKGGKITEKDKLRKFWSTAMAKTINMEAQLHAKLDGKKIIVTKSSVRRDLRLADEEGIDCLPSSTIFEQIALMGYQETIGDTIAQTRFKRMSKQSNDSLLARGNTLQSDVDRMKLDELMALCTNLQNRVLDLEQTKTTQKKEIASQQDGIDSLKRRVKKLEKRNKSRTHGLKRLYKVVREVFVAGKNENVVEEVVDVAQVSTAAITVTITSEEITLAQALEALKTSKPKDNGKGIMIEEPVKPKKKDQIRLDEEAAKKLQAEFDEEERLAREKSNKEERANIALIEEWDDIQEKKRLMLIIKKKKHFEAKRAEEKRNKPPTKSQHRKIMCTYLKNIEGYRLKQLKFFKFDRIQEMFDRAFRRVSTFEDFKIELVERKEKRVGVELVQKITKKQKVEDGKEKAELKQLIETILDEEEVAIDAIPLAVKSLRIVDWKIHKE